MKKVLYFDVETTGLDALRCSIVQLAGIIDVDGVEKERFNIFMRPFENSEISQEALKVIGKTKEEINSYGCPKKGYNKFREIKSFLPPLYLFNQTKLLNCLPRDPIPANDLEPIQ